MSDNTPAIDGLPSDILVEPVDDNAVVLVDENGVEHAFDILDFLELAYAGETREYVLLMETTPAANTELEDVLVMRTVEDAAGNLDRFEQIADEAEFQAVVAYLEGLETAQPDDVDQAA